MALSVLSRSPIPGQITLGEPQLHTDGALALIAFARDGSLLTVEEIGVLRRWNPREGRLLEWHPLSDLETLWAFSNDGRVLASASDDLTIWDVSTGQMLTSLAIQSWGTALAFHPDPGFVVVGQDDGAFAYWDVAGHHLMHGKRFAHHQRAISAVAISPEGTRVAIASEDKTISLWNLTDGELLGVLEGHTDRIPALAWHPDGRFLVSAGWDSTARVWDAKTLQPVILLNAHALQVGALAFSPDGNLLACADSLPSVRVWDFKSKKLLHTFEDGASEVPSLAFSPDGTLLASAGDRLVHLWEPRTGKTVMAGGFPAVARTSAAPLADGKTVIGNGGGGGARIWQVARQSSVPLEAPAPVHDIVAFSDGKRIAAACENVIRVWDACTGKVLADWDGPVETITTLALSQDGAYLASSSRIGQDVWIWNTETGDPVLIIPDALQGCAIETLAWHPAKPVLAIGGIDHLATGGSNGSLSLWNIVEKAEITSIFEGTTAVAFAPTGERLVAATLDHSVAVWDTDEGTMVHEFAGHEGLVRCMAVDPTGAWIVTGGEDSTLRFWDWQGDELGTYEVMSVPTSLTVASDGKTIVVGHANTTASTFALPTEVAELV